MTQKDLATQEMVSWLTHPGELGKKPSKIECAGEFDYEDLKYYIFKYKKGLFDAKWMLGVCGGYEDNKTDHCGHVFSQFGKFNPISAREDAIELVEIVRKYWRERAKDFMNDHV